ncbi:Hypothetical predicted protein [Octopus vulgaris]|uniref:Uncharacterized protein n=1 Tax=Octopus vulgaris TaxID=6645 RepID=A0AA36B807_OCTVU|nr:Hypothetical predicted protein [Octopus vulgaris]
MQRKYDCSQKRVHIPQIPVGLLGLDNSKCEFGSCIRVQQKTGVELRRRDISSCANDGSGDVVPPVIGFLPILSASSSRWHSDCLLLLPSLLLWLSLFSFVIVVAGVVLPGDGGGRDAITVVIILMDLYVCSELYYRDVLEVNTCIDLKSEYCIPNICCDFCNSLVRTCLVALDSHRTSSVNRFICQIKSSSIFLFETYSCYGGGYGGCGGDSGGGGGGGVCDDEG